MRIFSKTRGVLIDAYTIVSEALQKNGVSEHLFRMREHSALEDAKRRGLQEIAGYMVEDSGADEAVYDLHGARRAYTQEGRDRFIEVPYLQPPVDWVKKTGAPKKGAGTVPEYLMVKLASGANELSGEELMAMVRGMYYYNNYPGEDYFSNKKAEKAHADFVHEIEKDLAAAVVGKTVRLFSREERATMQKEAIMFREHQTEEDREKEPEK